ncbi:IF2B2 protein, partial [Polypterus senegalus]
MNKLYIGNLSPSVTAEDLKQLFGEWKLPLSGQVLLKSGYAFVDFPDQNWAIKAIEALSVNELASHPAWVLRLALAGNDLPWKNITAAKNHQGPKFKLSRKIQIRNIPPHLQWECREDKGEYWVLLVALVSREEKWLEGGSRDGKRTLWEEEQWAKRAIEKLTAHKFEDYSFRVSYILDMDAAPSPPVQRSRRGGRQTRDQGTSQPGTSGSPSASRLKQPDFPLRMLVPTQFVGAIIGKEGLTIKNVTKQTQSKYVSRGFSCGDLL